MPYVVLIHATNTPHIDSSKVLPVTQPQKLPNSEYTDKTKNLKIEQLVFISFIMSVLITAVTTVAARLANTFAINT